MYRFRGKSTENKEAASGEGGWPNMFDGASDEILPERRLEAGRLGLGGMFNGPSNDRPYPRRRISSYHRSPHAEVRHVLRRDRYEDDRIESYYNDPEGQYATRRREYYWRGN